MINPGLRTLLSFLHQIEEMAPVNFSRLSEARKYGYGMVTRYIKFCLQKELIVVLSERRTRGRYPSKSYGLSDRGRMVLEAFKGVEI